MSASRFAVPRSQVTWHNQIARNVGSSIILMLSDDERILRPTGVSYPRSGVMTCLRGTDKSISSFFKVLTTRIPRSVLEIATIDADGCKKRASLLLLLDVEKAAVVRLSTTVVLIMSQHPTTTVAVRAVMCVATETKHDSC